MRLAFIDVLSKVLVKYKDEIIIDLKMGNMIQNILQIKNYSLSVK